MNTMQSIKERCKQENKIYRYWYELDDVGLDCKTTFDLNKSVKVGVKKYNSLTGYSGYARATTEMISDNGFSLTYTRIVGWEVVLKSGIRSGEEYSETTEGTVFIPLEIINAITKVDTSNENKVLMTKSIRYD